MSQITDDIALGGAFGGEEEGVVQTIPTPTQGQDPNVDGIITEDTSLGGAFGGDQSPLAQTLTGEAADSAAAAQADADRAAASAAAAAISETNADVSEANALASKNAAATSASNAAASQSAAASSATIAEAAKVVAVNSAAAAAQSEANADASEAAALSSQQAAALSATNAATSASTATTAANTATTKAAQAATSESNAAASATSAATSAATATTKATEAASSATAAYNSEVAADASEAAALASQQAAAASQTASAASASSAASSATTATAQATNAATSASQAASSASSASADAASALASKNAAAASQAASAASQLAAASSATAAATSEANADISEANAAASAAAALISEQNADQSEANALTYSTNASSSADLSEEWAIKTTGTVTGSTEYSSKYYSQQSSASATNAASSATSSATSATASQTSATNSATSATSAANSALAAATSETNAATSAAEALVSEQNAANSETNAATSETNAATSETNAATSATQSASSATAASASQTAAATSAANALSSSQTATTAATTAVTKASEASASATTANVAATTATTAANTATSAATTATNAASTASNAAIDASNHEDAAAASATSAAASAASALTSKNAASTSETNAASSASSASTSASNAASSETNAASSATSAASSATTATTKASEASVSATNAATSETNALASETAAAASEAAASGSATAAASSAASALSSQTAASASASAASTSEINAAASELAASTSEINAASSELSASTSATNAATSEANAADSELNASNSATTASTAATTAVSAKNDAENSKNAAASSATAAATSATQANTSATSAATYASNSAASATNASAAEANALTYRNAAQAAQASAELALDQLTDLYLGAKTTAPTLDNDGNPLQVGALYANVTDSRLYFWTGSLWAATLLDANLQTQIDNAINAVIDNAPVDLDTLSELAAAINNDANFNTTIQTALGTKVTTDSAASLSSLTFTGSDYGTLSWNAEDETLDLTVSADVTYQLGQELGFVARNLSGVTLNNGAVVRVTGASGAKITCDLADNTSEALSSSTFAFVTETINNNSTGRITTNGLVRGLNTSGFTEGVAIWLGTNGTFTATKPTSPNHLVHLGWVVRSHATEGSVLAHISNGWELDELHDVNITSLTEGDTIRWNSTNHVWENVPYTLDEITSYGNTTTNDITVNNLTAQDVVVEGNLTVNGTTTTVNAENLSIADNMIYLNDGNTTVNPDLGWAGNYNDGTYAHAGFFRDATDGRFKAYDGYLPEPDASPEIDTSHASFSLADIQAATFYGNLSGNATTANAWSTARTITLGGDLTGNVSINGSSNVTLTANVTNYNDTNWDTAYSWGNHASAGYLTSYTETDPVFNAHVASSITATNLSNWNAAYNDRVTSLAFNTTNGVLTATQSDGGTVTVDLDNRYKLDGTFDNYVSWTISDGTASEAIASGNTLKIVGAGASSTSYDAATNTLTITSTDTNTDTNTTYSAGSGISLSGTTFSHADTSSQASVNNSGATVIQDITLDTYGHITGLASHTMTYSDVGAAAASHTHSYLPLSGGTMTGNIMMNDEYIDFKTSGNPALPQIRGYRGTTDLNTRLLESEGGLAWTTYDSSTANKPSGTTNNANGVLSLNTHGGSYGHQLAFNNTGGFWHRSEENGSVRSWDRVFTDGYHPNADKWTTARTLSLSGDASGSVSWDGSANATLSVTVNDDSHNHTIANVDGLQTALDGKAAASHSHSYLPLSGGTVSGETNYTLGLRSEYIDLGTQGDRTIQGLATRTTIGSTGGYGDLHLQHYGGNLHMMHGGGTAYINNNAVFHDGYHPNADKWTTARTNTVTLTGDVTGSGSASVDGTGNWTVSLSTVVGNDSHSHSNYVVANTTSNANIDSDWGQSFKTFDPIPSGTPPLSSPNIRTINVGENYARRTQIAFNYATDQAWFRRRQDSTWYDWREFIHSGNIGSQSVNYAASAGSASNADTLDGIHASGFVEQLGETGSPDYQASSSRRVNPNASNPTNEHYAITTFGNEGNVTGQVATHFVSGEAYTRGYNSGWSAWRRQWDSLNDGSGSGLDADLLDGQHGSYYYPASNPNGYITAAHLNDYTNGAYRVIADYSSTNTWYISSRNRFTWARSHDWTLTYDLFIGNGTAGANNGWVELGQRQSNASSGTFRGTRFVRHTSGSMVDGDVRAANYYIDGDTYYFKNGSWGFRHQTPSGYIEFGPANTGTAHIYTDRGSFYFNVNTLYANGSTVWHSGNDGSGSGLDADLLDGQHASAFATAGHTHNYLPSNTSWTYTEGKQGTFRSYDAIESASGDQASLEVFQDTAGADAFMQFHVGGDYAAYFGLAGDWNDFAVGGWSMGGVKHRVWHGGNDGSGSGLDADLLDGQHASAFMRATSANGYYGLTTPGGSSSDWIRTTTNGIIPYQSGGYSSLGTSSWPFSKVYASNFYGYLNGNISGSSTSCSGNASTASSASTSSSVSITGYGSNNFTYYQTSGTFNIHSGWHGYLISNHGDGSNYYRQVIALPFWGSPTHSRLEGGTQRGIYNMWTAENDGSGSGLDADLLDGNHASAFAPASHSHNYVTEGGTSFSGTYPMVVRTGTRTIYSDGDVTFNGTTSVINTTGGFTHNGNTVWSAANDGSGSGLDADLLDGKHASSFALSSHSHSYAAIPTASMSSSGYWKCNSTGLIIQWGYKYVGNNGSDYFSTWTFPLAFPNACWNVYVTLYNTTGNSFDASSAITSQTTSSAGFTVQEWSNQYQAITARFIAIGY